MQGYAPLGFREMASTPAMTSIEPRICCRAKDSPRNTWARYRVVTGPREPISAVFPEPIIRMTLE